MPTATRSVASMAPSARLLARQGSPVAKRCAQIITAAYVEGIAEMDIVADAGQRIVTAGTTSVKGKGRPSRGERSEHAARRGNRGGREAPCNARLTTMVEVGTHATFAWHAGPLAESGAERLLARLSSGMLVLADRYYCGFPLWSRAAATGADLLWRFKGNMKFPVVEALDDGSWRSVIRGSGRDRRRSRGELPVRIVAYRIEGGDETVMLATTLLDHRAALAAELAALYHERWEIETAYDEVKTRIFGPGAALRSKTPDLVYQEIDGLMLAHYAVRRLIHEAADKAGEDPDRISFVHAVRVMRRRIINPGAFPPRRPASRRD